MRNITIAIDGPSASGKSTVAKELAKKLNYSYLDTGAMYRAMAYFGMKNFNELTNENFVVNADKINIHFEGENLILNGEDVTTKVRANEMSMMASKVAAYPAVRSKLTDIQKEIAAQKSIIIDGRDIGTVIAPDAELKIFLTATPETRANRRLNDPKNTEVLDFDELVKEIKQRDFDDANRDIAPLKQADDAIYFDNSEMDLAQTLENIEKLALEQINK